MSTQTALKDKISKLPIGINYIMPSARTAERHKRLAEKLGRSDLTFVSVYRVLRGDVDFGRHVFIDSDLAGTELGSKAVDLIKVQLGG
jgi:hypothetical protein